MTTIIVYAGTIVMRIIDHNIVNKKMDIWQEKLDDLMSTIEELRQP